MDFQVGRYDLARLRIPHPAFAIEHQQFETEHFAQPAAGGAFLDFAIHAVGPKAQSRDRLGQPPGQVDDPVFADPEVLVEPPLGAHVLPPVVLGGDFQHECGDAAFLPHLVRQLGAARPPAECHEEVRYDNAGAVALLEVEGHVAPDDDRRRLLESDLRSLAEIAHQPEMVVALGHRVVLVGVAFLVTRHRRHEVVQGVRV